MYDDTNDTGKQPKFAPNQGWATQVGLTAEVLRGMYVEMTDAEIGARYGVSDTIIRYYRRKWGIRTINARQRADQGRVGLPTLESLTAPVLADLYAQMGDRQIAAMYGVQKPTIAALREKYGIGALSKRDRAVTRASEFTEIQKEICIGTLLGDAHVLGRGVLKVTHSQKQIEYLRRLHSLLAPHVTPIFYEEKELSESEAFAFGFRTVQHPWLIALHDVFYVGGRKVFPVSILSALTDRSLACWYWDDGHLDSGLPSFALGDVSDAEAAEVVRLVGERFALDTYVKPQSTPTCKLMGIRARSADVFFYRIREYVTPDLLYKIPQKHWPSGLVPKTFGSTPEEQRLSPDLMARCVLWNSASESEREALLDDLVVYWHERGFPHQSPRPEELVALHALEIPHVIQDGVIKGRQVGQATCHAFATHIWRARSYGAAASPHDIFADPGLLRKALRLSLDVGGVAPTGARLRGTLRLLRRSGVYNFRPSAAKALVDRHCRPGGVVWDPCAGYGGRLLGTVLSSALPRYVACEPQGETFTRLHHLRDWIDSYVPGVGERVSLHRVPAEDFDPPEVDMVMTSPPYWKREVYGDEATQSAVRYPTYEAWLAGFWKVVLAKAVRALKPGGGLVLNVDNFVIAGHTYDLVGDTTRAVVDLGLGEPEVLRYAMAAPNDPDNVEYVLCWTKGMTAAATVSVGSLTVSTCAGCGQPVPVLSLTDGRCSRCTAPKGTTVTCEGCGKPFVALRAGTRFHDEACYARFKRRKHREEVPAKIVRTFTCQTCGTRWETAEPGNFRTCGACREKADVAVRTKTCGYRVCGREFVDTSRKNTMTYCCPDHRDREKRLRLGLDEP